MAANIRNIKRLKLLRRLGLVGLVISSFSLIVVLILAFLPRDNSSFTIQIDNFSENSDKIHFTMSSSLKPGSGEKETSYLTAKPLTNALTSKAKDVEDYIDSLPELKEQQNFVDKSGIERAMVYTVYLKNTDETNPQGLVYNVALDGHYNPNEGSQDQSLAINDPIKYLRIMARTFVVEDSELPECRYFGYAIDRDPNLTRYAITDLGDGREPISSHSSIPNEKGETIYTKDFCSNGNDGYCEKFSDYKETGNLVDGAELVIPADKTICYTLVIYFEGQDYDCSGSVPSGYGLLMSLHFAIAK